MRYGSEMQKRMFVKGFSQQLDNAIFGVAGEAGEIADHFKKVRFHPKSERTPGPLDLRKEIGDLLWYLSVLNELCFGDSLLEVAKENVAKLKERYPDRYEDVDVAALEL